MTDVTLVGPIKDKKHKNKAEKRDNFSKIILD